MAAELTHPPSLFSRFCTQDSCKHPSKDPKKTLIPSAVVDISSLNHRPTRIVTEAHRRRQPFSPRDHVFRLFAFTSIERLKSSAPPTAHARTAVPVAHRAWAIESCRRRAISLGISSASSSPGPLGSSTLLFVTSSPTGDETECQSFAHPTLTSDDSRRSSYLCDIHFSQSRDRLRHATQA